MQQRTLNPAERADHADRTIATWLEARSGQPIAALAHALFRARLPDPVPPASWWVNRDQPRAECESQLP